MKTFLNNHLIKCLNIGNRLPLESSSLGVHSLGRRVANWKRYASESLKNLKPGKWLSARVDLAVVAAMTSKSLLKVNGRILIGLSLVGLVAPAVEAAYTWLDKRDVSLGGYYESYFMLFLCLGPYLYNVFSWIGAYYIFLPANTGRKKYLLALPLGLSISKMLWLLQVTSHAEFHSITPTQYLMYGVFVGAFLIFISDYLAWRYNHRARAHDIRLEHLATAHTMKLIPPERVADGFVTTWKEKQLKAY